jgi:hypothetical protein
MMRPVAICDVRPVSNQESTAVMNQPPQPTLSHGPVTTRAAIVARIEARISGQLSDNALAAWAFDRFYAEELGSEAYEAGAEEAIADVLDALMFGDDPGFRLDEEELRALIAQLGTL